MNKTAPSELLIGIKRVREEHGELRGLYSKQVEAIEELDALVRSQQINPEAASAQLTEGRQRTEAVLSLVHDAFQRHIALEERVLAPVFGETLLRGLQAEHRETWVLYDRFKAALMELWQEVKTPGELLTARPKIQGLIGDFTRGVESTAIAEESLMKMAERVLSGAATR